MIKNTNGFLKCPKCDNEMPTGYAFCNNCGAKLNNNRTQESNQPPINSRIIINPTTSLIFKVLFSVWPVIGITSAILGAITRNLELIGVLFIVGMAEFLLTFLIYHIFCRRQYAQIKREYILPGKISKFWSSMYYNIHLSIVILTAMIGIALLETSNITFSNILYGIILYIILLLPKFFVRMNLKRKYGENGAKTMEIIILRSGAGEPMFAKAMLMLVGVIGIMSPYKYVVMTSRGKEKVRHISDNIYEDVDGNRYYVK